LTTSSVELIENGSLIEPQNGVGRDKPADKEVDSDGSVVSC
jgi:hypothetical protein